MLHPNRPFPWPGFARPNLQGFQNLEGFSYILPITHYPLSYYPLPITHYPYGTLSLPSTLLATH